MIGKVSTFLGPNGLFQGVSATPSLVLSLDSNNILSYPGTGATWSDLSIRKNNGILNDVSSVTGSIPSTSLSFDGSTSYISFTQSDGIPSGDSQYTIEAWFNSNSYGPSEQGAIVGWGTTGVDNAANVLRLDTNGITNYWWNDDYSIGFSGTSSMIAGNWYYVVATYDGTVRKIYLNGELKGSDTPTGSHSVSDTSTLKIGHFHTNYFNGEISKVKISDKAVTSSRVLSNFNIDKVSYGYTFGSMIFNGYNSYSISTSNDYSFGTNDFTIEAFFNSSTASNSYAGIISLRGLSSFMDGVDINLQSANTSTPLIEFNTGTGFLTYTASNNQWFHVAISRTGGTSSYFVNGNLFSEVSDTTNYTNSDLVVGRYYTDLDDYYFNGVISNVRVLNGTGLYTGTFSIPDVQLSATYSNTKLLITSQQTTPSVDVSGLLHSVTASNIGWTSSLPSLFVTDGLICYLDNYTGGSTWNDLSGNGNNATLYNGYSYNSTNGGVIRFDGAGTQNNLASTSRGEINLDLTTTPCTIMYGTRYLQNTSGFIPSGRSMGGKNNNWLLGTWANSVNQFFTDAGGFVYGGSSNLPDMNWHIYTGTVNGPVKFWNNGTKLVEIAPNGDGPNGIVLASDTYGEASNCDISFVLVYNRVLSDSEIELNFNHFRGRLGL